MKSSRQGKILEIISSQNIETQEDLIDALKKQGFAATQATAPLLTTWHVPTPIFRHRP